MFKAKILLVDDVKVFMDVQKEFLRPSPVQVLMAKSGTEALETVRKERPGLVVMDVKMPEMDGITCCRAIKEDAELCSVRVVLTSSDGGHEIVDASDGAGCDRFMQKPVFGREFLNMVHSFLPVIERRRPRVACRVPVTVQVDGRTIEGITRDIGMNGLYIVSEDEVEAGSDVVASFRLPTSSYAVTVARGRVAWTNPPGTVQRGDLPAGFGVEFREITGEGVSHLRFCELTEFINDRAVSEHTDGAGKPLAL
ncbi:MAG TPA: response regulator [Geobacteraceae bacterium]